MDHHRLNEFALRRNEYSGDLLLLVKGSVTYKPIISRAFSHLYFSRTFEDRQGEHTWGSYIKGASDSDFEGIEQLCRVLKGHIYLVDDLDECYALGYHSELSAAGRYQRTVLGQLVRDAKPYDSGWNAGSKAEADKLATLMIDFFILLHPTYTRADMVIAVPPSNPDKPFDLPTYLVEQITAQVSFINATGAVRKIRHTRPMKECRTMEEKINNIKDAFDVDANVFQNRSVMVIDDIYQTGFSMNELGRMLRLAGAKSVLGLAATKTAQDLT
ncbi:MAG: hypothetical protein O3A14_08815 [Cyanobacteria bacterium]|nr:hypothetical protein [Cyanobacteriota bacterium]